MDVITFVELERQVRLCFHNLAAELKIFSSEYLQKFSWVKGYEGTRVEKKDKQGENSISENGSDTY